MESVLAQGTHTTHLDEEQQLSVYSARDLNREGRQIMALFGLMNFIIVSIVSGMGMLGSGFIVVVNLLDWAKGRRLNPCDRILLALGISGFCFQCTAFADMFLFNVWPVALKYLFAFLMHLKIWSGLARAWLITCLCIFYCLKIVDYDHCIFIWLKLRISKVVHWLLLGSVVGPLTLSIALQLILSRDSLQNSTNNLTSNSTVFEETLKGKQRYMLLGGIPGFFIPVLVAITSLIPILTSLYKHTRRMNSNASGFSQPRLEAHFAAARMVGSLLLVNIALICAHWAMLLSNSKFSLASIVFVGLSGPTLDSILILGNTKLRRELWKVLSLCRK